MNTLITPPAVPPGSGGDDTGGTGGGSFTIGPGQFFNSRTGQVGYDPSVLAGIEGNTRIGGGPPAGTGPGGGTGGGDGDNGGGPGGGAPGGGTGGPAGGGDLLTNVASTQTGTGTEGSVSSGSGEGAGEEPPELTTRGYFAALLNEEMGDSKMVEDVFVTREANTFDGETDHRAASILDGDGVTWDGDAYAEDGSYTRAEVNGTPMPPGTTTTSAVLSDDAGYAYLTYGRWAHTGSFGGSPTYGFVNHGWWLEGACPPTDVIARQTGRVAYSGEAYGTLWDEGEGSPVPHDLSGGFSATADFDNASIEEFRLDVSDGSGYAASIAGEAAGDIQADGSFEITGGDWELTVGGVPVSPDSTAAHGRFFGPDAEEVGGGWGMAGEYEGSEVGAAGVWAGRKQD
jgi:hypothetical protein